ncbi:hypothetical protein Droror1_Dr00026768, partial [Drosera rotundifolia]
PQPLPLRRAATPPPFSTPSLAPNSALFFFHHAAITLPHSPHIPSPPRTTPLILDVKVVLGLIVEGGCVAGFLAVLSWSIGDEYGVGQILDSCWIGV